MRVNTRSVISALVFVASYAVFSSALAQGAKRETFDGYATYPSDPAEMQSILDERDLHGGTQAYLWSMAIATMLAWEEANLKVADYLDLVLYVTPEEKRDIITANATTPYAVAYVDLTRTGGMVEITVPAGPVGGLVNDGQMRSVVDLGLAGPDKGKGGKYLILGPGVEEPANTTADFVVRSKSNLLFTGMRILAGDEAERNAMFAAYKLNAPGEPSTTKVVSIGDTPAEQFWSLTAYNAKTRAMVYTDRKDVSSRHDIFVEDDGSTPVYMSSDCSKMPHPQNCIDTTGQGDVFVYFRVYAPMQAYFDKTWTLPDIKRLN